MRNVLPKKLTDKETLKPKWRKIGYNSSYLANLLLKSITKNSPLNNSHHLFCQGRLCNLSPLR
ncbi:hypothetical protein A9306_03975 [Moraxella atlantae]|uniref:Uncharacterized protein n=1 Tax=Faucicola atlantae TaxID=34059 RepID=A0A1B8QKC2_9GAMM|nr:hypothetical protein A9306_03975 [Moraxella atlantae]